MSEIEKIRKEIKDVEETYLKNAIYIISDYNNENKTRDDYKGRQIYELLQNADDCYTETCNDIEVRFQLIDNCLIVQNTGKPFDSRGITSLMHTDASSKYQDTIGCKGLGFRSVLNWANEINIVTKEFCVSFSEEAAKEKLTFYKEHSDKTHIDELGKIDRIAILCSASVIYDEDIIGKYLENGFSSSIVLKCRPEFVGSIQQQLLELQFEELLFLKHIRTITIVSPEASRTIESIKEGETCYIQEKSSLTEWKIWEKHGALTDANEKEKKYEIIVAYNTDSVAREKLRKSGVLYSFFRTEIPMPFPFLVHGTFELTSERNNLVKENEFNRQLLSLLIDFIVEKGSSIADDGGKCDYEALKFLIPASGLYSLDKEYNFSNQLLERIKNFKVFPSIAGKYISIEDQPKYDNTRFDLFVNPADFANLLQYCDDDRICEFLKNNRVYSYSYTEFAERLNKSADLYVQKGTNIELIELYCDRYLYHDVAPDILMDNSGERITDKNIKVFNNPETAFDLPEWSKMRFMDKNMETVLRKHWNNCTVRTLADKLSKFGCEEYSFDRVVRELVSQSKDDVDKTKSLLFWLFKTWVKNGYKFPSALSNIELRIIARNSEIVGLSKCYFGREYNNLVGERIIEKTENPAFVTSLSELGLSDTNPDDAQLFLRQLGVGYYPRIELVDLPYDQTIEYREYNRQKYSTLFSDRNESLTAEEFFATCVTIRVDTVKGINEILQSCSFEDIVFWLLNDTDLYHHVINENEIDDNAVMIGKPPKKQDNRYVKKSQMRSWLRRYFVNEEWIETKTGRKVNSFNCTINNHDLSPIVEVINLDLAKMDEILGRSAKKDIELLFEKLGIAEDFVNLSKEKIYEILLGLPDLDTSYLIGKKIYTQLNLFYKDDKLNRLVTDNKKYEEFKKTGRVLTEKHKKLEYVPVGSAYYVGKKIYSDDILDNYPKLALNRRVGDPKVEKMFCVQSIQKIGTVEVKEIVDHPLNVDYQQEYIRFLPYIYAKRLAFDNKNRDLNILKRSNIQLVTDAITEYTIGDEIRRGRLENYELIYTNNIAYIKVPSSITSIDDLKNQMRFISAVAEVITTMLDVDGDKDAFMMILRCKSVRECETYFKENGDESLNVVNLSKEKFSTQINNKDEFWNSVAQAADQTIDDVRSQCSRIILETFDYSFIGNTSNYSTTKAIFDALNIDVAEYNKFAYDPIDLRPYYKEQFTNLKNAYRNRFFRYTAQKLQNNNGTKDIFAEERNKYNFADIEPENSFSYNVCLELEQIMGVSCSEIEALPGSFEELLQTLPDNEVGTTHGARIEEPADSAEELETPVDWCTLNQEIANGNNSGSSSPKIEAVQHGDSNHSGGNHTARSYDTRINQKKELVGFKAESKVYNTLLRMFANDASISIEWVSGNAEKANVVAQGDDGLGYDIRYSDSYGIHYVEVKGSSSKEIEFTLTKNEFDFAERHKNSFELWFVAIDENGNPKDPYKLGNLLEFDGEDNFFNNSKFSVEQSEFKIRAKIKED